MRVPPPCCRSRFRSSAGAEGTAECAGIGLGVISGAAGLGNAGVCIGRMVMVVVVFRVFRMDFARLSIDCFRVLLVVDWVLLICFVLRQDMVIRRRMAIDTVRVMFVFFMVFIIYCKGNKSKESVQGVSEG